MSSQGTEVYLLQRVVKKLICYSLRDIRGFTDLTPEERYIVGDAYTFEILKTWAEEVEDV